MEKKRTSTKRKRLTKYFSGTGMEGMNSFMGNPFAMKTLEMTMGSLAGLGQALQPEGDEMRNISPNTNQNLAKGGMVGKYNKGGVIPVEVEDGEDRKSVVQGKSVDRGGRRIIKKKNKKNKKKKEGDHTENIRSLV